MSGIVCERMPGETGRRVGWNLPGPVPSGLSGHEREKDRNREPREKV